MSHLIRSCTVFHLIFHSQKMFSKFCRLTLVLLSAFLALKGLVSTLVIVLKAIIMCLLI